MMKLKLYSDHLFSMTDPEEARDVFRIARCNVKRFAIVYLAWAQFELSLQGMKDSALKSSRRVLVQNLIQYIYWIKR